MIENEIMLEENPATFSEIDKLAVAAQQTLTNLQSQRGRLVV